MNKENIRVRFAPSPTGMLHVGGVRTALFNYLFAKRHNGKFILRLEDTDRERFVPEGVEQIVKALDWLGLKPDEGFWISEGEHQNIEYMQSERHGRGMYQKYADQLVEAGLAYYSPTSSEKLNELREQAKVQKQAFLYRKSLDVNNTQAKSTNVPIRLDIEAVRAKLGEEKINWNDMIRGNFSDDLSIIEDFILIKSDGFPTYNFANVIDDNDMEITHVIRGDEFIASTAKHILLYKLLGLNNNIPKFVHLPVINGTDGKKLSKRTGDTNTLDYRDKGYLPEALLNFLALLGWNDGTEDEIFTLYELEEKFTLDRVQKSPAVFDPTRLEWINGKWIREKLSINDLVERLREYLPKEWYENEDYLKKVIELDRERIKTLSDSQQLINFFFEEPKLTKDILASDDSSKLKAEYINKTVNALESVNFKHDQIEQAMRSLVEELNIKAGELFGLIRIVICGHNQAPGLFETLEVLGKEKSIKRLKVALSILQND